MNEYELITLRHAIKKLDTRMNELEHAMSQVVPMVEALRSGVEGAGDALTAVFARLKVLEDKTKRLGGDLLL